MQKTNKNNPLNPFFRGLYRIYKMKKILRKIWNIIWGTIVHFNQHNCPIMAAGMSFFGLLSLIPLLLLGVSLLGHILGSSEDAQKFAFKSLNENFPTSASAILDNVKEIITSPKRVLINSLSILGLAWSGMRFFNILQGVLNSIWVGATQRNIIIGRLFGILIFIIAGVLFWASFIFTSLMAWVRELNVAFRGIKLGEFRLFWFTLELVTMLISWVIMLFLVYFFIPHVKVSWKAALIGAVFSAIFMQFFKYVFSLIMVRFDVYGRVYGPLAGIIIFMSWLYISMSILLYGAELGSQCQKVIFNIGSDKTL
jgi:membrane protein